MTDMANIQTSGTPEPYIFYTGAELNVVQARKHTDLEITNAFPTMWDQAHRPTPGLIPHLPKLESIKWTAVVLC